jgi:P27 family predicted phage terminase small subunit
MVQRGRKSAAALAVVPLKSETFRPHPQFDPPQPPPHLGEPERLIWGGIVRDFELATEASTAVLITALEAHMRARECREIIAREGMTVAGRDGQTKVHPLLAVERDARQSWLSAIKALGLEL